MLKVYFENLGNIAKGNVEINNLTIFAGQNNTGKTYVAYTLYSLLDKDFEYDLNSLNTIIENLYKEGFYELDLTKFFETNYQKMKQELELAFSKNLSLIFSANENYFEKFELNEADIKKQILISEHRTNITIGKKNKIVFEVIKQKNNTQLKTILLEDTIPKDVIYDQIKSSFN
jgi:predicted ATPase